MDLYSETILDYYKNPRNKGKLPDAQAHAIEHNPSCGDIIEIYLNFDDQGRVSEISYDGHGCAISQAGASMLTEEILGKTTKEILALQNQDIYDLLGVEISAGRVKCALLGLVAAKNAVLNFPPNFSQ